MRLKMRLKYTIRKSPPEILSKHNLVRTAKPTKIWSLPVGSNSSISKLQMKSFFLMRPLEMLFSSSTEESKDRGKQWAKKKLLFNPLTQS